MNEGHHSAISRFILGLSSVRVSVRLPVCTRVNILLLCRLSASCHSWTAHEHICQCHEVEPFPARACNLFHFPWVFGLLHKSLWKCGMQKKKEKKKRNRSSFFTWLLVRCCWQRANVNAFVHLQKLELDRFMLYAHGPDLCRESDLRHAMANCFEALMGEIPLRSREKGGWWSGRRTKQRNAFRVN